MTDGTPRVTVVTPTYNERQNLPALAARVLALGPVYSLLVVDDNSPDGTGQIADELAATHPGRLGVMHRRRKEGIGPAYVAGFRRALAGAADVIVQMDADLSHDPAELPAVVAALTEADLAIGSRYTPGGSTKGWPVWRQWMSQGGCRYARWALDVPIDDLTGGFKAWRRETLAAIDLDRIAADGYGFQIETTVRALQNGARVTEVPIVFHERIAGASKISRGIVLEAAFLVWKLRLEGGSRQS